VANLREFHPEAGHERLCAALLESFADVYGGGFTVQTMDPEGMTDQPDLLETVARHGDESWRFGRTPRFSHHLEHRFPWGGVDLHLDVVKGEIRSVALFSDCLSTELVDDVRAALCGAAYRREELGRRVLSRVPREAPHHPQAAAFCDWLTLALPVR
jgi:lipoate-protein ligase A